MNHSHILYDSDPHFKIDPISRKITNESSTKTTIIQHDHNSERFTFEVPRYVEGHDLSLCNIVEVHYLNIEANSKTVRNGVYTVDDLQVKEGDENTVVCSWLITDNATQFVGQLQFLIRFSCAQADTGTVDYVWNTGIYSSLSVSLGIYNSETPSDNRQPAFNFVTTIDGQMLKFFVGTQAKFDALSHEDKQGLFAIITDDKAKEKIEKALREISNQLELKEISTLDELTNLIYDNVNKTIFINLSENITIAGKGTLPKYGRGTVVINDDGDAGISLIDHTANMCVAFYNRAGHPTDELERWIVRDKPIVAETAITLSGGWTYAGEVTVDGNGNPDGFGSKGMGGWGLAPDELYAVKIIDRTNKRIYSFIIANDCVDGRGTSYSTYAQEIIDGKAKLINISCQVRDITILGIEIRRKNIDDTTAVSPRTFEVYWKKIF